MKNILVISLFVLSFIGCKADGVKKGQSFINHEKAQKDVALPDNSYMLFKGYFEDFPVFRNVRDNALYISKETGKLSLYKKIDKGQRPFFINDKALITGDGNAIILNYCDGTNEEIYIGSKIYDIISNAELTKLLFINKDSELEIIDMMDKKRINTKIKCALIQLVDNTLYYLVAEDISFVSSKLYKTDFPSFSTRSLVAKNVQEENSWMITPDENYITCRGIHPEEGFKIMILNINNKEVKFPDVSLSYGHFYSFQEKAIVFFDPSTFNIKIVKLED